MHTTSTSNDNNIQPELPVQLYLSKAQSVINNMKRINWKLLFEVNFSQNSTNKNVQLDLFAHE